MRRVILGGVLSLALVLSACGSDGKQVATSADRTTTSSSTTTTSTSTTTTTSPCHFIGTTEPQQNAVPGVDQLLTDVTTETDGCVDAVTFTFRPSSAAAPGYKIEYATGPFYNSAGDTVQPPGTAFLKVRFQPAWIADVNMQSAPLTYTGPRVITPTAMKTVRGLALFDSSEAVVGWIIGLDGQHPYEIAASPGKVVITLG